MCFSSLYYQYVYSPDVTACKSSGDRVPSPHWFPLAATWYSWNISPFDWSVWQVIHKLVARACFSVVLARGFPFQHCLSSWNRTFLLLVAVDDMRICLGIDNFCVYSSVFATICFWSNKFVWSPVLREFAFGWTSSCGSSFISTMKTSGYLVNSIVYMFLQRLELSDFCVVSNALTPGILTSRFSDTATTSSIPSGLCLKLPLLPFYV